MTDWLKEAENVPWPEVEKRLAAVGIKYPWEPRQAFAMLLCAEAAEKARVTVAESLIGIVEKLQQVLPLTGLYQSLIPATRCSHRSSVTDQQCLLADGHAADSPTRFHRFKTQRHVPPWEVGP